MRIMKCDWCGAYITQKYWSSSNPALSNYVFCSEKCAREKDKTLEPSKPSPQDRLKDGRSCTTCANFGECWVISTEVSMNTWRGHSPATGDCSLSNGLIGYEPASSQQLATIAKKLDYYRQLEQDRDMKRKLILDHYEKASEYKFSEQEDYDMAILEYNEIIRLDPDQHIAYKDRGDCYFKIKDYDEAIEDYTMFIRIYPNIGSSSDYLNDEVFFNRGEAYFTNGDYDKAIEDYAMCIQLSHDPEHWDHGTANCFSSYFKRGEAYFAKKDYDKAIEDYNFLLRLDPDCIYTDTIKACCRRGDAYFAKKNYDKAIKDYNHVEKSIPDRLLYLQEHDWLVDERQILNSILVCGFYRNRGEAYKAKGDTARADADFAKAKELGWQADEQQEPAVEPKKAETAANKTAEEHIKKGLLFFEREDYDTAILEFNEAIRLDPDYIYYDYDIGLSGYECRGETYLANEDYDKAIEDYTMAIRLEPDKFEAYLKRGKAYFAKKDYDKAIKNYNQAEKLIEQADKPDDFVIESFLYFGILLTNSFEYDGVYSSRAEAYFAKKDYDKAIEDCTHLLEYDEVPYFYRLRGSAYKAKGDTARAEADFAKAKELEEEE